MSRTVLKIQGITCINCVNKIEASLRTVKGVTDVSIDQKKGSATVTHDDSVSNKEDLIRAVVDVGFRAEVKRGLFG